MIFAVCNPHLAICRRRAIFSIPILSLLILIFIIVPIAGNSENPFFTLIDFRGPVSPPLMDFIVEGISTSSDEGAQGLIIQMDTPGGLDESMRGIIKEMLNAPIPCIVYIAPMGARAASAGAIITIASDVAVMAPGTNIGAAHPMSMGGKIDEDMEKKVVNDMVAYVRGIAEEKGRNADWAEKAVRESISITAKDAKEKGVIDILAEDIDELLEKLDGLEIKKGNVTIQLDAKGARIKRMEMNLRQRILSAISNPNIAYILMMIGIWGLFFELSNPGVILPGVIGAISLILAFYSLQTLPVNYAGVALILLALILFIAEVKVVSYGMLTVGGIISMLFGSLMLFKTPDAGFEVARSIIITTTITTAVLVLVIGYLVLKAHREKPASGYEGLLGGIGVVTTRIDGNGKVFIHGEYWNAESEEIIEVGEKMLVTKVEGLVLKVTKVGS